MVPKVFISSTNADLRDFRQAARDAALKVGCFPVMFEHWSASGSRVPLEACLEAVRECDLLVAIVAHRYGWVPDAERATGYRSITWLECETALQAGKEVVAFVVEDGCPWPIELREEYGAIEAVRKGVPTPEELLAIRRGVEELGKFKAWLNSLGIRAVFNSPADLRGEIIAALNDWRLQRTDVSPHLAEESGDPARYLHNLYEVCRYIDIRGLHVGSGKAHRFPIEELYIPLQFRANAAVSSRNLSEIPDEQLKAILGHRCSVLIGDPGSGKTTLLRRIGFHLAASWLRINSTPTPEELTIEDELPLPFFVRLSDLSMFVERAVANPAADVPTEWDSATWLLRFLAKMAVDNNFGLSEGWFHKLLEEGRGIVLVDGLDEAPTLQARKVMSRLIEKCAQVYKDCRFVVTSRPKAYTAETMLYAFEPFEVQSLSESAVRLFLSRWCEALFPDEPSLREKHLAELQFALESRSDIRRMALNPVMLTALAVVHWNQKRIPEQRAELYESIIMWLARARENRKGRSSAERCINLLQAIALAMQNSGEGRLVELSRRSAAELIAPRFEDADSGVEAAESFLVEEELDSGIVVARGDNLRFWHLSFQEFLAARATAALRERDQGRLLLANLDKTLSSEWRETVLLFAGIIYHQGPEKLDAFLGLVLGSDPTSSTLPRKAKIVGLIGSIQRDLASFHYKFQDPRFEGIRTNVMSVFDVAGAQILEPAARLEAAEAIGQSGDPRLDEQHWTEMPGGTFLIGAQHSDPDAPGYDPCALKNEGPCTVLAVETFRISQFPVTVSEFELFVADGGYDEPKCWSQAGFGRWKHPEQWDTQLQYPNRPVVGVSWYEAEAYCRWTGYGVRLPTGVQWERAARGAEGRSFPWGDQQPNDLLLNYISTPVSRKEQDSSCVGRPTPVGFYPAGATPEGLMDMGGNVFEWCQDEVKDSIKTVRGGAYNSVALFVRAAFRGRYDASTRKDFIGFRVCAGPL